MYLVRTIGCNVVFRLFGKCTVAVVVFVAVVVLDVWKEEPRKHSVVARNHDECYVVAVRLILAGGGSVFKTDESESVIYLDCGSWSLACVQACRGVIPR